MDYITVKKHPLHLLKGGICLLRVSRNRNLVFSRLLKLSSRVKNFPPQPADISAYLIKRYTLQNTGHEDSKHQPPQAYR